PDDPRTLVLSARSGVYADSRIGDYRQNVADGVIGAAARARQAVLVDDVRRDPRYIPVPGAPTIRSELAVPLRVGGTLLGVLNVESEQRFSPEDAEGFAIVADQLSVAVHNASLFAGTQRALEETQMLHATSQRIGMAMDVDDVVRAYLEQVAARGRY